VFQITGSCKPQDHLSTCMVFHGKRKEKQVIYISRIRSPCTTVTSKKKTYLGHRNVLASWICASNNHRDEVGRTENKITRLIIQREGKVFQSGINADRRLGEVAGLLLARLSRLRDSSGPPNLTTVVDHRRIKPPERSLSSLDEETFFDC